MVYYIIACHKENQGQMLGENDVEQLVKTQVLGAGRQGLGECYALTNSVSKRKYRPHICKKNRLTKPNSKWDHLTS